MKKKILITLIAVFTILFTFGMINASAEKEGIYTYTVSDGKATITRCDETVGGEIIIPNTLGGYPVTCIDDSAFSECINLVSVTIPEGVTEIGLRAFSECSNLTSITIPDSITRIRPYAFQFCNSLERVDISDISAWCEIDFESYASSPLSEEGNLYLNGLLVTSVTIPDNITSIGDYAFDGCNSLINVTIKDNITSIGSSAFSGCNLTSVTIPDSVTNIGTAAFSSCSNLSSVTIPDSITSIGNRAFDGCNNLERVDISNLSAWCKIEFGSYDANPLCYAGNLYLNGSLVTSVTIPDNITSIGDYTFSGYDSLVSVTIPNSVITIGESVFEDCDNLVSVMIPNSIITIGEAAFLGCSSLINVTIPDSVTNIGEDAFAYCRNITNLSIGNGIETIPSYAFNSPIYTSKLKYVALPAEIKYIQDGAFNGCSNIETVFYAGSESQWNEIVFYSNNGNLTSAKIVYNATKKTYRFETNCDAKLDDITDYAIFTMPTVQNDGMTLSGWYDNKSLSGEPVTFPYYGDATTLYAAWTDRTGKSFDDAFIAKANQEYTVSTTENGQYVYFEFVPKLSKEYRFYTTGNLDTYGCLYDSNQYQLTSDDDDGDGNNFYISYNLTAGETYYIAAKLYSGTGTFTFVVEEPVDYRINEITIKDMSGNSLQAIPTGTFLATVSFTNVSSSADTVIILAQYTDAGAFKGLMYIQTEDVPTGSTIKLSIPVDNSNGDVAKLKAFCWESFASLTPMGNSASFPAE